MFNAGGGWHFGKTLSTIDVAIKNSLKQKSAEVKPIETRKELAKVANVSHDTIAKVNQVVKQR